MQVHATEKFSSAIIMDEDGLSKLWKHINDFVGGVSATVSCIDGLERKFKNLDDLLSYENTVRAAAETIELYGYGTNSDRSVTITVGRKYGVPIEVSIRGDEQDVIIMKNKIIDSVSGMRAWYSPLATVDRYIIGGLICGILILVLRLMTPSTTDKQTERSLIEAILEVGAFLLFFITPVFIVLVGIIKLHARYFPIVSILIGQGKQRYRIDEQVRWTVVIGFIVSLTASAIYALLSRT